MKKIVLSVVALIGLIAVIMLVPSKSTNADFLRIHIRADSNDSADQQVKYVVKSAVVNWAARRATTGGAWCIRRCAS